MKKAVLTFTLPADARDHAIAVKADALWSVLRDLDEWLRFKVKAHGESEQFQATRTHLADLRVEHGVADLFD